ncbi:ATP-binding protein [Streptomyces luteolifulvus]|jgi:anti-sigma regulatory factor (Ser/Thr protein kinase)|uniref:ATP-binding protein n=1 Tax=Streptomyces luteolifulvus TaxID=2615112 RepID=UPI00177AE183|nr:ATP-binding protein [Streptomyces luteolifulvus]
MTSVLSPTATGVLSHTETLPCEPASARRARMLVSEALDAWGMGELAESGTLIVSELFNNTVDHTGCRVVQVLVQRKTDDVIRIGVADQCRDAPEPARPGHYAEDGRGLILLEELSWRWGYDMHHGGKLVWAELQVPEQADLAYLPYGSCPRAS